MESITDGIRQQISDNISRLLQQEGSLLRKLVRDEQMEHEVEYFDSIDPSEAFTRERRDNDDDNLDYDITNMIGSAGDYAFRSPKLNRRQLAARQIFWHTSFDSGDKLNVMLEPKSFQVKDAAWALGRQYDRIILKALAAPVKTGRTGSEVKHFELDTQVIPVGVGLTNGTNSLIAPDQADDIIGAAAEDNVSIEEKAKLGGLTLAKLLKANEILKKNMFGAGDKLYFICSQSQISQLLHDPHITSADYNSVRTLVDGSVNSFAGFEFIVTEMLGGIKPNIIAPNNFTVRDCYGFTESSMLFGRVKGAFVSNADRLPQHMDAILVKAMDSVGALRMNDKGVVCVKCLEKYNSAHSGFKSAADDDGRKSNFVSVVPSSLFLSQADGTSADHAATNLGLTDEASVTNIAKNIAA